MATDSARTYPSEMPVLALRDTVVLPLTVQPLAISRPASVEAVNRALAGDRLVFLTLQTVEADDPQPNDLKTIGTIGAIRQMAKVPHGGVHVLVEGLTRGTADLVTHTANAVRATVRPLPEDAERNLEVGDAAAEVYVSRLRRKLVGSGTAIRTLRGFGYQLGPEEESSA